MSYPRGLNEFEEWAAAEGLDLEQGAGDGNFFVNPATQAAWVQSRAPYNPSENKVGPVQLHAEIKHDSRYSCQIPIARANGEYPFEVCIAPEQGEYCVNGGPGSRYRLIDVNLYVIYGGIRSRIN